MKRLIILIIISLFLIGFITASITTSAINNDSSGNQTQNQDNGGQYPNQTQENRIICCKVYGFGSNMEEVNVEYKLMKRKNCVVSEDFVGGNKEIVEDSNCQDNEIICCKVLKASKIQKGLSIAYEKIEKSNCVSGENDVSKVTRGIVNDSNCQANQNQERTLTQSQIKNIIKARNRIRHRYTNQSECPLRCSCTGSVTRCQFEDETREMTIMAGKSGNIIIQTKGINASTNVTLYKSEDKIYGVFKNNETKEVKILPDQIKDKLKEKIKAQLENQTIELDEDGIYRIQGRKKARLFFLFPVRIKVQAEIDSETGEIIRIRNPWWGFLAKDIEEEESTLVCCAITPVVAPDVEVTTTYELMEESECSIVNEDGELIVGANYEIVDDGFCEE